MGTADSSAWNAAVPVSNNTRRLVVLVGALLQHGQRARGERRRGRRRARGEDGIAAGDLVVTEGGDRLRDGARVQLPGAPAYSRT